MNLIELLLCSIMGVILITGCCTFYLSQKSIYNKQQSLFLIQENQRYLSEFLRPYLQNMQQIGCINKKNVALKNIARTLPSSFLASPENWVRFSNKKLIIQYTDPESIQLRESLQSTQQYLYLTTSNTKFLTNDLALITNCKDAEIFRISQSYNDSQGQVLYINDDVNFSQLKNNYQPKSEVYKIKFVEFGITDSEQFFFTDKLTGYRQEIMQGVKDWKLTINLDTNDDHHADYSIPLTHWNGIDRGLSVEIDVTLSVKDNIEVHLNKTYEI